MSSDRGAVAIIGGGPGGVGCAIILKRRDNTQADVVVGPLASTIGRGFRTALLALVSGDRHRDVFMRTLRPIFLGRFLRDMAVGMWPFGRSRHLRRDGELSQAEAETAP